MKYTIICVGKIKESYYRDAITEYKKRLSRYGEVNIIEVPDEKTPDGASQALEDNIKRKEGQRILEKIKDTMHIIALDLKGKEYDSVEFAMHLEDCKLHGKSHITFVIGGSLGLHQSVLDISHESISFSHFTFPHQLMRVILLEQLYRATKIQNHEPYHK